jgi:hypothetical protein
MNYGTFGNKIIKNYVVYTLSTNLNEKKSQKKYVWYLKSGKELKIYLTQNHNTKVCADATAHHKQTTDC